MPKNLLNVEQALAQLQRLIRRPAQTREVAMSADVPEDLRSAKPELLGLSSQERQALEKVRSALPTDQRFEHLTQRAVDSTTWRFVCLAYFEANHDHVAAFVVNHGREPMHRTCFFPVELLAIETSIELYGVTLMPAEAIEPPPMPFGADPKPTMASIVAVKCTGTNHDSMQVRARAIAEHALRLLRATLREHSFMPDPQLWFRLGDFVWFDDNTRGWRSPPGQGSKLTLDQELVRYVTTQEISTLPHVPTNDTERRTNLALRWFERAQLETDSTIKLLYLFFALEAILGDTSEGLKAHALAVRRAMLGLLTTGSFTHPTFTYLLYDKIRSAAVHGEETLQITTREVAGFAWDVRRALNEFLQYARAEGFVKRAQVRTALDNDERRKGVVEGLVRDDPGLWGRYVDSS